jgi:uncharacterized protein YgbK (DUF1537 family)
MYSNIKHVLEKLPSEYTGELLRAIRKEFILSGKSVVVLDDDPTGTQTCHDVIVLTSWTVRLIVEELKKKPSILFILTNSRSLPEGAAVQLTLEIALNLKKASKESEREIVPISRSDSTLRGHFPAEVDALAQALEMDDAVWILLPAFIEGGRFTIDDVHYIVENQECVPVSDTPFARDASFGYTHSNLKEWVEEKTKGAVKTGEVMSLSLADIRHGGPQRVCDTLLVCRSRQICIVNACSYKDLEVFVMGVLLAEKKGKRFLYRTSASFVSISAGIAPGHIFKPGREQVVSPHGSLVVVGSYVPKTTSQLDYLLAKGSHQSIEINVLELLRSNDNTAYAASVIKQVDQWMASGKDVIIYTSRRLEVGKDPDSSLRVNGLVSAFLVSIIKGITVRPSFIIAKGGITSSDLATKGLSVEKALILGQAIPGVPVWELDKKSKFPGLIYVVFPGNVGDHTALEQVCVKLLSLPK